LPAWQAFIRAVFPARVGGIHIGPGFDQQLGERTPAAHRANMSGVL